MGSRFTTFAASLGIGLWSVFVLAQQSSPVDIYERLKFAGDNRLESGVFDCTVTKIRKPRAGAMAEIDKRLGEYKAGVQDDIASGRIPDDWKQKIAKQFGTNDLSKIMNEPGVRTMLDRQLKGMVEARRQALIDEASPSTEKRETKIYVAANGRVRLENNYLSLRSGSTEDATFANRKETFVLTPEYVKCYTTHPSASVGAGMIYKGLSQSKQFALWDFGEPVPTRVGTPSMLARSADDITAVESEDTSEGRALKITTSVPADQVGTGNVQLLWVLPDKGYRVYKHENYVNGLLMKREVCTGYRQLEPGSWFPSAQVVQVISATIPGEVRQKVMAGSLPLTASQVLESQIIQEMTEITRQFNKISANETISGELFDIVFPPGTNVYDYTQTKDGKALTYKVGGLPDRHDPLKTLDAASKVTPVVTPETLPRSISKPAEVIGHSTVGNQEGTGRKPYWFVGVGIATVALFTLWLYKRRQASSRA